MSELEPWLDHLRAGDPIGAENVTGFAVIPQPMDSPTFQEERARQLDALERRFQLRWEDPDSAKFRRFSLGPGEGAG
jgi:hypothetical protein